MIPTPDTSHLTKDDFSRIYEPAEDTFLLLDALEEDAEELRAMKPRICLEIGSGSGCVSSFIGSILGSSNTIYLCTDINAHAALCTLRTGHQNKIPLNPIIASFAQPLQPRLHHSVDILLFNPPYVPTDIPEADAAQLGGNIASTWAGGTDGMDVMNVLLEQVSDLLSPNGRFYLVALKQNNIPEIQYRMQQRYGLHSKIVIQRRAGPEHLFIVRFSR